MGIHAGDFQLARTFSPAPSLRLGLVKVQGEGRRQRFEVSLNCSEGDTDAETTQSGIDGLCVDALGVSWDGTEHCPLPHHGIGHLPLLIDCFRRSMSPRANFDLQVGEFKASIFQTTQHDVCHDMFTLCDF
jgi:hypothetical protein